MDAILKTRLLETNQNQFLDLLPQIYEQLYKYSSIHVSSCF